MSDGSAGPEAIAIIGMAARVPGAQTMSELWRCIVEGRSAVTRFSDGELAASGVPAAVFSRPDYVKASAIIEDIDLFDAEFFGLTPAEAAMMDPQHRLFLECAWQALEDAGHDPLRTENTIGLYGGCFMNKYLLQNLATNEEFQRSPHAVGARNFNDKDFLCGRAAYAMNLRGPVVTVQTACSTSLVATHLATQALLSYECDIALVGGVAINLPQRAGYLAIEGSIFSRSGNCRPFDMRADGTLFGNGAGFVVLRRLSDARRDGDDVRALIRGTAINNDGFGKVSFTAPNARAQTDVVVAAQTVAGVAPSTIGYVEAHGTGTRVGDPLEVAALTEAFGRGVASAPWCALGSVKANVGHLDAAAGVLGMIRAVLALQHRTIPPQANFSAPNPELGLGKGPFYIPARAQPWPERPHPRRAGVSSFGVGGTNAHVVLEEAPRPELEDAGVPQEHLLVLSARTERALAQSCEALAQYLESTAAPDLRAVAATLAKGRSHFAKRTSLVCSGSGEAVAALRRGQKAAHAKDARASVGFMFPGVGTQFPNMGLQLYEELPTFRQEVDRCATILNGKLDMDIRRFLYPAAFAGPALDLESVPHVLAAIFTTEYALTQAWASFGVQPSVMIGHSLGEYVAACIAEVLSLEDALDLTVRRGKIFLEIPQGRMMGIPLPAHQVQPLLGAGLSIGAVNGPGLCMVTGEQAELRALQERLMARGVPCKPLPIRMASHSPLVEPFLKEFERVVGSYQLGAPKIPYTSCVSGDWIRNEDATNPEYWARQLRQPVQFAAMAATVASRSSVLLEAGPGSTLTSLMRAQGMTALPATVSCMRRTAEDQDSDRRGLLRAAGGLWNTGVAVNVAAVQGVENDRRVPLPTYPFQRRRHWIDAGRSLHTPASSPRTPEGSAAMTAELPSGMDSIFRAGERPAPSAYEQVLRNVWVQGLGIDTIGLDDDFNDLGGHSLLAAQVVAELRAIFPCELSVVDLFRAPTVRGLARTLRERLDGTVEEGAGSLELASEIALDPQIRVSRRRLGLADGVLGRVFLTGATGFLGSFLLRELLNQNCDEILCLVRCASEQDGKARVLDALSRARIPLHGCERIRIVRGDLSLPLFGLDQDSFAALADQVDAIYNCGAWVNFARPYAVLKAANVLGVQEVLRMATTGETKPVHHVSTIFVNMGAIVDRVEQVSEDDPLPAAKGHDTGYTQSKWVAEGLCRVARDRGVPVSIYRPGNLLGAFDTGFPNRDDYLSRVIQACIQMGAAPRRDYRLPVGAVDDVAKAIVRISGNAALQGNTFHVIQPDPLPWDDMFSAIRSCGYDVPSIAWTDWCARLSSALKQDSSNALLPLADMMSAEPDRPMPRFDAARVHRARAALDLPYPVLNGAYFERMVATLLHQDESNGLPGAAERSSDTIST